MSFQSFPASRTLHFVAKKPGTVSEVLAAHMGFSVSHIQHLFEMGAIYLDKKRVFADTEFGSQAYLRIHKEPKRFPVDSINWEATVLAETKDFLVVNKPAGIPVHATLDNQVENILHQLRQKKNMPLFVTQRIDIPVSGLVILAKTPEFQRLFNRFLSERRIEKRYKALVEKPVGEGKYSHFMEQSDRAPKRMSEKNIPNWVSCELTVHSCRAVSDLYECEVELHTGRTHQIRAQLSFLGASIVGDFLYRAKKKAPEILGEGAIGLHSYQVSWSQRRGEKTEYRHDPIW